MDSRVLAYDALARAGQEWAQNHPAAHDLIDRQIAEVKKAIEQAYAAGRKDGAREEREGCAVACDEHSNQCHASIAVEKSATNIAELLAAAGACSMVAFKIRARGQDNG